MSARHLRLHVSLGDARMLFRRNEARFLGHVLGSASAPKNISYNIRKCAEFNPHKYTSGRWLRDDKMERAMRFINFDFNALCERVLGLCPGARSISNIQKLEGGFNRVFVFTLNNSQRVVAKLPFSLAGPSSLRTASEVATVKYLQAKTSVPIPKILDWNDLTLNPIGSEYIIMEHAKGVQLHHKWHNMSGDERVRCIDAIYQKLKEAVDLEFPAFGSLTFEESHPPDTKIPLSEGFCIGPHCAPRYWDCKASEPRYYHNAQPNQGPWTSLDAYSEALVDAGVSRVPPSDPHAAHRASYHGSIQAHLDLLESSRSLLRELCADPRIQAAAHPTLFHPDLHKRNIFVSEDNTSVITGIIDWQSACIEPAFWYSDEVPDFAAPDDSESNISAKTFDLCTRFLTLKLSRAKLMDENLFRPFLYCYRTWKDGAVALRHELIKTSQKCSELGLIGSSPYALPSPRELAEHQREYKLFVAAHELKHDLADLLNTGTDGWVSLEEWEATKLAHQEMFDGMLNAVLTNKDVDDDEPVKDEKTLRSIWPFDLTN